MASFEGFDPLICEVKKRPALYNPLFKEYRETEAKEKLWEEVYEAVVEGWHDLSPKEKQRKGESVLRRWRSLRDGFRRELQRQKRGTPRRRKYLYFNQMLFLSSISKWGDPSPVSGEDEEMYGNSTYAEEPASHLMENKPLPNIVKVCEVQLHDVLQNTAEEKPTQPNVTHLCEKHLHKRSENKSDEQNEEDKLFFLSLVPEFRKIKDDQKLDIKIELLQVIKRGQQMSNQTSSKQCF